MALGFPSRQVKLRPAKEYFYPRRESSISVRLDGAHLLEPLHPGLALRSPLTAPLGGAPRQDNTEESSFYSDSLGSETGQASQTSQVSQAADQQPRTLTEFQLKFGLGWRRLQQALFNCAACCVRCIGPV